VHHLRTVKLMATRAAATAAVAGGGLMLAATAASAATGAGAAPSVGSSSAPVSYNCPMTSFGQGAAPLNINGTISVPAQATAGTTVTVTLVTNTTTVPAATAANLQNITNIVINGNAAFSGSWNGNASLTGTTALGSSANALNQIPGMNLTGTVTPTGTGQALLAAPTTITIQLTNAGQMAPITCTRVNPVSVALNLLAAGATGTGTGIGTGAGGAAGAQSFACTITTAGAAANTMTLPMTLGFNQLNLGTMGNVWMAGNGFTQQLGMGNLTMLSGSGSIAWSGAGATGTIPLSASLNGGNLMLGGHFMPRHMGMTRLTAAQRFQLRMRQMQTNNTVVVVCTTTAPATTMANVGAADMNSAAAQGVAAGEGAGVGAGAPNTGGGGSLHSSSDMGLMAGGGAALLAGIGIVLYAMRRRSRTAGL
jgi:hypothetical protein